MRITDYNAITSVTSTDVLPVVDVNDTTQSAAGSFKRMTLAQLSTNLAIPETLGCPLTSGGEGSYNRLLCNSTLALVTQGLIVSYWTAATTQTAGHIQTYTAGAALQSADCTVAEIAVFAVNAATGALTSQLAITANLHATLWAADYATYTSAFTSSWSQVQGTTYAVAFLAVCTGTMPQLAGATSSALNLNPSAGIPPMFAYVASQTTMPASVVAGSLAGGPNGNQNPYFVMTT